MAKVKDTATNDMLVTRNGVYRPPDFWHCDCGHRHQSLDAAFRCGKKFTPHRAPKGGWITLEESVKRFLRQNRRTKSN